MEKRTCGNCAYRGSDGYCPCMGMMVMDHEYCYKHWRKDRFSSLEIFVMWLFIFVAIVLACIMFTGCSPNEKPTTSETVVLEVSDKPAPSICEEQEPMDIESVEDLELEYEEVAAMDDVPRHEECNQGHSVLTMSGGVNYYNDKRETWYSSNVLRHYRIGEWDAGDDGVWRDSEGYIIIASSDMPMGSTYETSLGMAKVYDTGCDAGTVDVYVNW